MFDQHDDSIATRLRNQLLAYDRECPKPTEVYQGLGQIIQDVILLISIVRTEFFDEAMVHLQVLVRSTGSEMKEDTANAVRASNAYTKILIQQITSSICESSTIFSHCGARYAGN